MSSALGNLYNPGALSDEELRQSFSVRLDVLADLINSLTQESSGSIAHNHLILAQRGMGKTTLLLRLGLAIREHAELSQRFLPLTFKEEQYSLSLKDFWLACLASLVERLRRNSPDNDAHCQAIEQQCAELMKQDEHAEAEALALLLRYQNQLQRRFVLLLDNLDLILESLDEPESWRFRATLQSPGGPILIAAAAHAPEDGFRYDKAFYEHLHSRWLNPLTRDELFELINNLALQSQRPDISLELARNPERVLAFKYFTGGNPRALKMLFKTLQTGLEQDVEHDLKDLLDLATPLYKARLEALSAQQRRVFLTVADAWSPITAAAVEEKLKLGINSASANLAALVKSGLLTHAPINAKKLHFEVAERLFNIWYLMRANTRASLRMLWLVKFLQTLYRNDPAVLAQLAEKMLANEALTHVVVQLTEGVIEASNTRQRALSKLSAPERDEALQIAKAHATQLDNEQWEIAAAAFSARTFSYYDWALPILCEYHIDLSALMDVDDAYEAIYPLCLHSEKTRAILQQQAVDAENLRGLGVVNWWNDQYDQAEAMVMQALELDPYYAFAWNTLGNVKKDSKKPEEAESAYRKAIALNANFAVPWYNLATLLVTQARFEEAEQSFKAGFALQPQFEFYHVEYAKLLMLLDRANEAEVILRQSLARKPKQLEAWKMLVHVLDEANRSVEAESQLRQAIELFPSESALWLELSWFWQEPNCVKEQNLTSLKRLFESAVQAKKLPHCLEELLRSLVQAGHLALVWSLTLDTAFGMRLQEQARPLYEAIRLLATEQVDAIALLPAEVRELCFAVLQQMDSNFANAIARSQSALVASFAQTKSLNDDAIDPSRRRYIARRGHLVHKLKAKDTTKRWAYYFVLVEAKREAEFLKAIKGEGDVDLESFGEIIASNYGEEPSEEVRSYLRRKFDFWV